MDPEIKRLDTEDQYTKARSTLMSLGFAERSEVIGPGMRSCVLVAPDGYSLRLVWDEKQDAPS